VTGLSWTHEELGCPICRSARVHGIDHAHDIFPVHERGHHHGHDHAHARRNRGWAHQPVSVIGNVDVDVSAHVSVAALVNGNDIVEVTGLSWTHEELGCPICRCGHHHNHDHAHVDVHVPVSVVLAP